MKVELFCTQCHRKRQLTINVGKPIRRLPCQHFLDEWGKYRGVRMGLTSDRMIWQDVDDDE